jgi:hypothetical protein
VDTYSHGGDLGDLLAALASIRQLSTDVDLVLPKTENVVREPWTPAKVERVRSFLELQPYIRRVRYADQPEGRNLDEWRRHYKKGLNLADMFADWCHVPHWDREVPWCLVDRPEHVARVVIHRSPRYHGRGFPWREVVQRYGSIAVMVGSADEHRAFVRQFGPVEHYPTETLLDLARTLAGAELVVCNQSAPSMLGESLKVKKWLEQCRGHSRNCHWHRREAYYDTHRPPALSVTA